MVPSKSEATVWFDLSLVLHLEIGSKRGKAPMIWRKRENFRKRVLVVVGKMGILDELAIDNIRELKHVIYMMRERGELGFILKDGGGYGDIGEPF